MATKNVPLIIAVPGRGNAPVTVSFVASAADGDLFRIPRRYPINSTDIKYPAGFFRHNVIQNSGGSPSFDVSSELGGSMSVGANSTLGFELPRTEKLVLLAKKGTTGAETLTFKGSEEYRIADVVVTLPAAANGNDGVGTIYEIDLFDLGLFVGRKAGQAIAEDGVLIVANTAETAVALIARVA